MVMSPQFSPDLSESQDRTAATLFLVHRKLEAREKNEKPCYNLMASRFFGMNRAGYFLLFFDFLIFLAFLTDLHPQDLHIMPTSFRGKNS